MHNKPMVDGRPVEIERKYLVAPPDEAAMSAVRACSGYSSSGIEQQYVTGDHGENARIRRREFADECRYYYTVKENINGLSKFETEFEITAQDYERLSKQRREETYPVRKVRHCFVFEDQLFELDIYDFKEPFATLEIELEREDQPVSLPGFLNITEDVTGNIQYSNFMLSRSAVSV